VVTYYPELPKVRDGGGVWTIMGRKTVLKRMSLIKLERKRAATARKAAHKMTAGTTDAPI